MQNAEIIGVDYSESMLNAARKNAQAIKMDKIKLIRGDVGNLPFESDFFVHNFCERLGYFTAPYETLETLQEQLSKIYRFVTITHVESFAGFICKK